MMLLFALYLADSFCWNLIEVALGLSNIELPSRWCLA